MTAFPHLPFLDAGQIHLRIMATTDLHMHLLPWDYWTDRPNPDVGLARTTGLIARARAGAANTVLVDNGDILQGTPMGDLMADLMAEAGRAQGPDAGHPMIAAMNLLGYDAANLGNHEFNYGIDFLMAALSKARFPVVSANVVTEVGPTARQDSTLLPPYVLLDRMVTDAAGVRHPLRIGLLGLLPPQIMIWDRDLLSGRVCARDILDTAAAYVPEMREAGADLVIALSHSGIGTAHGTAGMENASLALAAQGGIDAVVAGHSHEVFPSPVFANRAGVDVQRGTLSGVPATMAGAYGSHLGLIDLVLERAERGWRVAAGHGSAVRVAATGETPDPEQDRLAEVIGDAHAATLASVRRAVGYSTLPLNTHFAMVAPVPALALLAEAKRWHVADKLKHSGFSDLPVLGTAAPFKAGGRSGPGFYTDIPAGPLAVRHIADLYAFPNTVSALILTGDLVADWLERAAAAFLPLIPGKADQPLLNPDFPTSGFDVIFGLTYVFDLSQPPRYSPQGDVINGGSQRVGAIRHNGRPLRPDDRFIIATDSYRAGGGGHFPGAGPDRIIYSDPRRNREVLCDYIAARGRIESAAPPAALAAALADPVWRFAPLAGTSAVFDTAPLAQVRPGDLPGLDIAPVGAGPDGFARFRIRF